MQTAKIAGVTLSRLLLGSNPFSGFSHQGTDRDREMVKWYTTARIKEALFEAERLGITGIVARTDHHVMRFLREYWDEGGKLQWCAQTCPGVGPTEFCVREAASGGAKVVHIHGGVMDHLVATGKTDEVMRGIEVARQLGLGVGLAGHNVRVFEWAERHAEADYYMCCYYNPTPREDSPEHVHGATETYREEHRKAMTDLIRGIKRPVIHYKIMAAGRNDPEEAFAFAGRAMRPGDFACIGIHSKDDPAMIRKDVELFDKHVR